jgi:hypothetical protein
MSRSVMSRCLGHSPANQGVVQSKEIPDATKKAHGGNSVYACQCQKLVFVYIQNTELLVGSSKSFGRLCWRQR